jgi:hypothetical protein
MHGGTISSADHWLGFWIPKIEATQSYQQGHLAIIITWDEGIDPLNYPSKCAPGTDCKLINTPSQVGPFDCTQGDENNNPIITSSQAATGGDLLIGGNDSPQCHIPTIVMSAGTPAGTTDTTFYTHYSMLKTTEELLGLPQIQNNNSLEVGTTNCAYGVSNHLYPLGISTRTTCDQWGAGDNLSGANDFCTISTGLNCGSAAPTIPGGTIATNGINPQRTAYSKVGPTS